jgi:hypothetical protein
MKNHLTIGTKMKICENKYPKSWVNININTWFIIWRGFIA